MEKPVQPKLLKNLTNEDIGEIFRWPKDQVRFGPAQAKEIRAAVDRAKRAGFSKEYVMRWDKFYQDTAFWDVGNDMAAARHLYLRDIVRAW